MTSVDGKAESVRPMSVPDDLEISKHDSREQDSDVSMFPPAGRLRAKGLRNFADEYNPVRADEILQANIVAGASLLRRQLDELMEPTVET